MKPVLQIINLCDINSDDIYLYKIINDLEGIGERQEGPRIITYYYNDCAVEGQKFSHEEGERIKNLLVDGYLFRGFSKEQSNEAKRLRLLDYQDYQEERINRID